ncbi:AAA family ATPase [Desulfoplanes sp.]
MKKLELKGFKSIDSEGQKIVFQDINIFLGANGAGKSNLVSFFKMLGYMMTGALQVSVADQGYADSILYFGSKKTEAIEARLIFESGLMDRDIYGFTLTPSFGGNFMFRNEYLEWSRTSSESPAYIDLGAGHKESNLIADAEQEGGSSRFLLMLLRNCRVFQFHDTSSSAKVRNPGYINDTKYFRSDAGNLAAFLYAIRENKDEWKYYRRIVNRIREIVPQFDDFSLAPDGGNDQYIRLDWKEKGADYLFGPHQLSDGTLRFMALSALLLQPPRTLPQVIVLDEPELGLHPSAISSLAGMVRQASKQCQVVMATQSTRLVDEFDPEHVIIVDRDERHKRTVFSRLDEDTLREWCGRYSLAELWEKNALGGRP